MPDPRPELYEYLKKIWLPVTAFIGAATAVYQFIQLWRGDRETVTWVIASLGLAALVVTLLFVSFSKTASSVDPSRRIYRYPRGKRRARGALALLIILVGVAFGWLYKHDLELRKKTVVIVTNFDGPDPQRYRITEQILVQLRDSLAEFDDTAVISLKETVTEQEGSEKARSLGSSYNPDLVLWGWYGVTGTDVLLTIHVERLAETKVISISQSEVDSMQADVAELNHFRFQQSVSKGLGAFLLFMSGVARYEAKDFRETVRRMTAAVELGEWPEGLVTKALMLFYRGTSHYFLENHQQALPDLTQAIQIKPDFAEAYNNRGVSHGSLGMHQEALADFSRAIQLHPRFVEAYDNRGMEYKELGKFQEALSDHSQAIQITRISPPLTTTGVTFTPPLGRTPKLLKTLLMP